MPIVFNPPKNLISDTDFLSELDMHLDISKHVIANKKLSIDININALGVNSSSLDIEESEGDFSATFYSIDNITLCCIQSFKTPSKNLSSET